MPDFKKEWIEKSDIDYFSEFMTLWLGFNSWYRSHYSELPQKDRILIEKLKSDFSGRNQPYVKYSDLIKEGQIKENLKFKSDLESLHYSLLEAEISYPRGYYIGVITYTSALSDYVHRKDANSYLNLIKRPRQPDKIKLGKICIISESRIFFPCLIEIIYQIRCLLFHGHLEPSKENHEVVKYCYFILLSLIE
jgi:hypothetical protein